MTLLNKALAVIPGYTEAKTAVDTVKQWRPPQRPEMGAETRRIAAELAEAATAGRELPVGLAERLFNEQRLGAHEVEVARLIRETLTGAQDALNNAINRNTGRAYNYLQTQVDTLTKQIRAERDSLAALVGLDADTAIRAGRVKDWQHAESLIERYAEIRHAHFSILCIEDSTTQRHVFAVSGQLPDPCDIDPYWVYRRTYYSGRTTAVPAADYRAHVDWLNAAQGKPTETHLRSDIYPTTMHPLQWLLTIAEHKPWVPNHHELIDAHTIEFTATGADLAAAHARRQMIGKEPVNA